MRASVRCFDVGAHPSLTSISWCSAGLPGPVGHEASRELVDDGDAAVGADQIVRVPAKQVTGGERLTHEVLAPQAAGPDAAERPGELLHALPAARGEGHLALRRVDPEVVADIETIGQGQSMLIDVTPGVALSRARDDERCPCLVDEHAVGLVDDRVVQPAKDETAGASVLAVQLFELELEATGPVAEHEAVSEVIEAELLVGAVRHVAGIGRAPRVRVHAVHDDAHR